MKKRRGLSKILIIIMSLVFFVTPVYAAAGSITINLKELGTENEGIVFELYQVGETDEKGMPVINPAYGNYDSFENAEEVEKVVKELCGKVEKEPEYTGKTNADGRLQVSDVTEGVYLVMVKQSEKYGEIQPFLVSFPYYREVHGKTEGPLYQVEIEPKASGTEEGKPSKPDIPLKTDKSEKDAPTTSDKTQIERYMHLMTWSGLLCILITFYSIKRREKRNEEMEKN